MRQWYQRSEEHGETRELKDIPPVELDRLLSHFFVTVRKKNGSLYEPDTLILIISVKHRSTSDTAEKALQHHQRSAVRGTQGIQEILEKGGERQ